MKLSIITPYYNTLKETLELAGILIPQLTEDVEWIIVDDGCNEKELDLLKLNKVKVIHLEKNSGCAGKPRNVGLDNAEGEYITFVDSDDLVSDDYINQILKAIKHDKDIIYLSWKSNKQEIIMVIRPPKWNCAVWCRVYKRSVIGNVRFDEKLKIAEDWVFNESIKPNSSVCVKKTVYYYNQGRKGSLTNG